MSGWLRRRFLARGDVHPRDLPGGASQLRAECLIEGTEPRIEVTARFSQAVERQVLDAAGNRVEELIVAGRRHRSGESLEEREVTLPALPDRTAAVRPAGRRRAALDGGGVRVGELIWGWEPLHCTVEAWIERLAPGLRRVRVEIANRLEWDGGPPERAWRRSLHATHLLLHSPDGAFASLAHPPTHLRTESARCRNEGLWPTPVGAAGDRRTVLFAPVRLDDYPRLDGNPPVGVAA